MSTADGTIIAQRYRLGRKLGEGGMGAVYEAEHVVTGRRFAVKVLERKGLPPEAAERFLREARAPAQIGHPNVVEIIDAGTEPDGTPFIAMELLEGETLDDVIKRERVVQPGTLAAVMDQLLDGLAAMHARGFVHRDLKPANIFLVQPAGAPLRVKLLDFGIAKALGEESRTQSGYVIGTPAYMAPEQMRSARDATPRSDLWSVGVMLYECLSGHRPFRGETFGLLAQIAGPAPARPLHEAAPHLPAALCDLVDRLLSKDVTARPASATRVREELVPLLARCPAVFPVEPPDDSLPETRANRLGTAATESSPRAPWQEGAVWGWGDGEARDRGALRDERQREREHHGGDDLAAAGPEARGGAGGRRLLLGALMGVLLALGAGVALLWRTDSNDTRGAQQNRGGGALVVDPHPTRPVPLATNAELRAWLTRWNNAIQSGHGHASVSAFYMDAVQYHGGSSLETPETVRRELADFFAQGGARAFDWSRSQWQEDPVDLNSGASIACINAAGATGRIVKVRAWASEDFPGRTPAIGCQHLEGVYLIRLRRVAGALKICHETWSVREGICASCPGAHSCQSQSTTEQRL